MKRTGVLLLIVVCSGTFTVKAQFWTGLNGPYGGTINDLVVHSSGALLVATGNGVYRSTDSGATWARQSLGTDNIFNDLEIDGSGKIYAASNSVRIYTSSDAGVTWTQLVSTGLLSLSRKIKVAPSGNIYVADAVGRIMKSTNNGTNFATSFTFFSTINDLDVAANNNVYVATSGQGVQVSVDGAVNFNGPSVGLSATSTVFSIAISGTTIFALASDAPYKGTTTAGSTVYASTKANLTDVSFSGIIDLDPSGNIYLANSSFSKIYTSTAASAGAAWSAGVAFAYNLQATASYFSSTTTWYLGLSIYGLSKTVNTGVAWSPSSTGIKALPLTNTMFISPATNHLFMTWSSGIGFFTSADDGVTWTLNSSAAGNTNRALNGIIKLGDNSFLAYGTGAIRSTNDGVNWTVQNAAQALPQVVTADGTNLNSFSGTNWLKSSSQGVTWTPTALTGLPGTPTKMQVDGSGNVYFLASGKVYKVLAAGTTASELTALTAIATTTVNDFQVVSSVLYAIANGNTLCTSANGGTSFSTKVTPASSANLWVYDSKNMFIQGTVGNFYISHDGGGIWANELLIDSQAKVTDVAISSSNYRAYLATVNSVAHKSVAKVIPPPAPTALIMAGKGFDQVELLWTDNSPNEDYFTVEQSIGDNTHYDSVGYYPGVTTNQGKINTTVFSLSKNTIYFFRVSAKNAAGKSVYTNEVTVTTLDQCSTSPIPNNRSWTAVVVTDAGTPSGPGPFTNAAAQVVSIANAPNNYTIPNFEYNINPDGDLGAGTFVESCGQTLFLESNAMSNGNGTWNGTNTILLKWQNTPDFTFFQGTTTLTLNPTDPIPATPTLNAYLYSSTEVLLNWNKTAFETQYVIQRSAVSGSGYATIATVNYGSVTYIDKNLTTGQPYYYVIFAKNAAGSSASSSEVGIQMGPVLFRPVENDIQLNHENQQGVSWGDLDGDGDEDIASPSFVNNLGQSVPPVFYENMGNGKDFTRRDLVVLQNENTAVSRGINIFDFNNDGKLDLYITRSANNTTDLLLINNGSWDFTKTAVTPTQPFNNGFRSSAAADYDNDGKVDVFVGNDSGTNPATLRSQLLKNTGASSFTEIVTGALVTDLIDSRNVSWADYDNDGDQDIFVHDSGVPARANRLYKNNGDGTFTRVTGLIFDTDVFFAPRTSSWGDIDNDGDLDLYVGSQNAGVADRLYQNNGNGTFTSLSNAATETGTATYGSTFGDIDNDGDLDLIAINSGANSIFYNDGSGVFTKYTVQEMITHPNIFEIGGSMGDFNQDGFLDIYPPKGNTALVDLPNFLYKNTLASSSSRNWIEVQLIGNPSNAAAIGARVTVTTASPSRTQIREISTRTGFGSQNSLIQHFGLATATNITQLQIKWPSGNVMTLSNISSNQIFLIKEDVAGPTFTLGPLNGAANAPVANPLTITVTDNSTPVSVVAGKKVTLATTANPGTPIQIWDVTNGTLVGNTYSFALSIPLQYLTQYTVTVDAGAFADKYQNPSLGVGVGSWNFTTMDVPDITAPVIAPFTPIQAVAKNNASAQSFTTTVTDDKAVTFVKMFHRKVSQQSFTSSIGIPGANNTYAFSLQDSYFDDMGIEYYFKAYDAAVNMTRSPTDSTKYLTRTIFNNTNTGIPVTAGGGANDYQIIAVPYELPSQQVQSIFEELGDPDKTKWRLLKYQQTPQAWIDYPSSSFTDVSQGVGYFINSRAGQNIAIGTSATYDVKAPNNKQGSLFTLNLKKGWNLIGNPYTLKIIWDDSRLAVTEVGALKVYSGGTYTDAPELDRLKGGFVLADNDVQVPVKLNVTPQGGRKGFDPIPTDISQEYWIAPLMVEQQGLKYTLGGIGMNPAASVTKDDFDDVNPPHLFDFLELNFDHPEYFLRRFSRDVVPTQNEYIWNFDVDSNLEGIAELSWDNSAFGKGGKELYLFDVALQRPIDMSASNKYAFNPRESGRFKIYFGEHLEKKIKPDRVLLGKAFPNPSTGVTRIPFTLPGYTASFRVKLEVYDFLGNRIATLADGEFGPGFYSCDWNSALSNASDGLYIYRIIVADPNQEVGQTGKVVLKK